MSGEPAEPEPAGPPTLIDERAAAARLTRRWLQATSNPRPSAAQLAAQVTVLAEAGRLLLRFWEEELADSDRGTLPSPTLRVQRRHAVCAREFEAICADGRGRFEAFETLISDGDGPSATILREMREVAAEIAKVSQMAEAMRSLIEAHADELRLALPGTDAAELRQKVDEVVLKLQNMVAHLPSEQPPWKFLGWVPPASLRPALKAVTWWGKEASKILAGVLGAVIILKGVGLIAPWAQDIGLGTLQVLAHEVDVYTETAKLARDNASDHQKAIGRPIGECRDVTTHKRAECDAPNSEAVPH